MQNFNAYIYKQTKRGNKENGLKIHNQLSKNNKEKGDEKKTDKVKIKRKDEPIKIK